MTRTAMRTASYSRGNNPFHKFENGKLLDTCFNDDILPDGDDLFRDDDLRPNLYSSDREWIEYDDSDDPDLPTLHERHLHKLFWDQELSNVLVLSGDVGIGKSTLVKYYLRCYCPARAPELFQHKLLITIDAKSLGDDTNVVANLYYKTQHRVRTAFAAAQEPLRLTGTPRVHQWLLNAFEEIARRQDKSATTLKYIVFVLDNLDQCTAHAQGLLLRELDDWRQTYYKTFWRIIIPLWPGTLEYHRGINFALFRSAKAFAVGPLRTPCHSVRATHLRNVILSRLDTTDITASDCGEFLARSTERLSELNVWTFVRGLCMGDLRRELQIISDYYRNDDAYFQHTRNTSYYDALRHVLIGRMDSFAHSVTRIANILLLGHEHTYPRDMLIGWHMLQLHTSPFTTKRLYRILGALGYSSDNIDAAFHNGWTLNWYHGHLSNRYGDVDLIVHASIMGAYMRLAVAPYYVDCIAWTTPVEADVLKAMRRVEAEGAGDAFVAQVNVSLEVIAAVRTDEEAFVDVKTTRPDLPYGAFVATLSTQRLRWLWRGMAQQYHGRLRGLRESGTLPSISDEQWDTWMAHKCMREWQRTPYCYVEITSQQQGS